MSRVNERMIVFTETNSTFEQIAPQIPLGQAFTTTQEERIDPNSIGKTKGHGSIYEHG